METPILNNILPQDWDAQVNKISKQLAELGEKAEKIVVKLDPTGLDKAAKTISEYNKKAKELTEEQVRLNAQIKEQERLQKAVIASSAQLNNAQTKEAVNLAALNYTKKEQNRITALQTQLQRSEAGSMNALSAQYSLNLIELNKYSQEQIKASTRLQSMQLETAKLREQMNLLKQTTGDHTLDVGRYQKALQGATGAMGSSSKAANNAYYQTFQLTQVMRELPNFAIDARVGFMSISNNLPMLAEGFQNLSRSIDQSTGKMLGTTGALKIFARSLLSLNTIFIAISAAMVLINNSKFREWLSRVTGSADAATVAINAFNKSLKDGNSIFNLGIESIAKTQSAINLYEKGLISAEQALGVYNKELGDTYGRHTDVNKAISEANRLTPAYMEALRAQAQAHVTLQEVVRLTAEAETERANDTISNWARIGYGAKTVLQAVTDPKNLANWKWTYDLVKDLANADDNILKNREQKAQESQDRADEMMNTYLSQVEEYYTKLGESGLKSELDIAKDKEKTARESYEKLTSYSENRGRIEREIYESEKKAARETADGIVQSYEEREKASMALYQLRSALTQAELDEGKYAAREELKRDEQKIKNQALQYKGEKTIKAVINKEEVLMTEAMFQSLENARKNHSIEVLKLEDENSISILKNADELTENLYSIETDRYKDQVEALNISNEEKLRMYDEYGERQKAKLKELSSSEIVASAFGWDKDTAFEELNLQYEVGLLSLNQEKSFIEEQLSLAKEGTQEHIDLLKEQAEKEREITALRSGYQIDHLTLIKAKTAEAYKDMAKELKSILGDGIDAYYEIQASRDEEELERFTEKKEEELEILEESYEKGAMSEEVYNNEKQRIADEQDSFEEEMAERERKRERDSFLIGQALALAGVWIKYSETLGAYNLAQAELSAMLTPLLGPGAAAAALAAYAPLKATATVSAVSNTALIAAQTIPYFAEGGEMPYTGEAMVGDSQLWGGKKKKEVLISPDGLMRITPDYPTIMRLEKGTRILPDVNEIPSIEDVNRKIVVNSVFRSEEIIQRLDTLIDVTGKKPKLIDKVKLNRMLKN